MDNCALAADLSRGMYALRMDPAMALVLALSLIVPRLTVADSPLRLQRSFWTSACTSILEIRAVLDRLGEVREDAGTGLSRLL